MLLDEGAELKHGGRMLLSKAMADGQEGVLRLLLKAGATVNVLNGPNKRNCKKCKGKLPNRTVTWQAKGLVMRKREHDRYWAAVCRAGIDGNLGMARAAEWIHVGWGMGVSPEAGGAGGKGVMWKRARDKGRGTLDTDKEKAGGHAGVRAPMTR